MKRKNNLSSAAVAARENGEAEWKREVNNLRRTATHLWHELLLLESLSCLEINDRVDFFEEVRKFEVRLIKRALFHAGGSQTKSARLLGVGASTLNNKIKRYRIPVSTSLNNLATDSQPKEHTNE